MRQRVCVAILAALALGTGACGGSGGGTDAGRDPGVDLPDLADPGPGDLATVDAPGTDLPGTDLPGTDLAGDDDAMPIDLPGTDLPGTDLPIPTDVPGLDLPLLELPVNTDLPGLDGPGPELPPPADVSVDVVPTEVDVTLALTLVSLSGSVPAVGARATLLSHDDGSPLGQEQVSDGAGNVTFHVLQGRPFAVRLTRDDCMDSYRFGLNSDAPEHSADILSLDTKAALLAAMGATLEAGKGMVVGTIAFRAAGGDSQGVGCATVQASPAGSVFYFDEKGPTSPEKAPSTRSDKSDFIVLNLPAGAVSFTAKVAGVQVASGSGLAFADSITMGVVASGSGAANPTPAGCTR
jgi:hypothetical protein